MREMANCWRVCAVFRVVFLEFFGIVAGFFGIASTDFGFFLLFLDFFGR